MLRRLGRVLMVVVIAGAVAPQAQAATLKMSHLPRTLDWSFEYRAGAGERNDVLVETTAGENRSLIFWDGGAPIYFADDFTQSRCYIAVTTAAICPLGAPERLASVAVHLLDGADEGRARFSAPSERAPFFADMIAFHGGPGDDRLFGDASKPFDTHACGTLRGDLGDDRLAGGPGCEYLVGGLGADDMSGGGGSDWADYGEFSHGQDVRQPVVPERRNGAAISLDGIPDDGAAGEGDNVRADVEHVYGTAYDDLIVGSAADNHIVGDQGADTIDGGAGDDTLSGGGDDGDAPLVADVEGGGRLTGGPGRDEVFGGDAGDEIDVRDGEADFYSCGGHDDTLFADVFDTRYPFLPAEDCESIALG